ncbi:MAG: copper chaperone PCu(A)C [Burkholderiales bacterium]|nr:copper chaperone PCu(A)C [Burkholderiales bacterium]
MKKFTRLALTTLFCAAISPLALAQVKVSDAWVRATVVQQKSTGAFMQLTSVKDAKLVDVSSPAAAIVELHQMSMTNNIMKMHAISSLDLPAGKPVMLSPGGYHVMLVDLKKQVKEGDIIPITLTIEAQDKHRETIEVKAVARPLNQAMQGMQH